MAGACCGLGMRLRVWAVLLMVATRCLSQDSGRPGGAAGDSSARSSSASGRLVSSPSLIRAGDSFTLSLVDPTPSERNLSSIAVTLTSSKLNEESRTLLLEPQYAASGSTSSAGPALVGSFSIRIETVRSETASRPDLAAINVLPGTRLDMLYTVSSSNAGDSAMLAASPDSNLDIIHSFLEVTDEARIVLPDLITPGQSV